MTLFILACATVVIVSFFCSLLEASLLSLDDIHLETKRRQGHSYAAIWQHLKRRIDRPIAAILILNTIAHTGGATVAGGAFDAIYGADWIWLFSLGFTVVVLVCTEIIPKVIGVNFAEQLAGVLARPLAMMTTLLTPLITLTDLVARPFKRKSEQHRLSLADLRTMADLARSERLIGMEEETIIINATKLRVLTVSEIMVPRHRIALFDARQSNIANFEIAASSLHTRYPVSQDGTVEGITGYVNFKEIVAMMPSRRQAQIEPYIRPLSRIAAEASLNNALRILLGRREHMALVEDQERRIVGLVTLEDLLEEIVGDLTDEFDWMPEEIVHVADARWKIGGGATVAEVIRRIGIMDIEGDHSLTLSDWVHSRLGRDPATGDVVTTEQGSFTVIQTRRRKAYRVLVEKTGSQDGTSHAAPDGKCQ
jgi:CBS domain containing-hemolysin-like protein